MRTAAESATTRSRGPPPPWRCRQRSPSAASGWQTGSVVSETGRNRQLSAVRQTAGDLEYAYALLPQAEDGANQQHHPHATQRQAAQIAGEPLFRPECYANGSRTTGAASGWWSSGDLRPRVCDSAPLVECERQLRVEQPSSRIRVAGVVHHLAERTLIAERRRAIEEILDSQRDGRVPESWRRFLARSISRRRRPCARCRPHRAFVGIAGRKVLRQRRGPCTIDSS